MIASTTSRVPTASLTTSPSTTAYSYPRGAGPSRVTSTGVEGDPMLATPEKGKAFAECSINNLVEFARIFREMKVAEDVDLNHQNDAL